jgi:hypothetical protein
LVHSVGGECAANGQSESVARMLLARRGPSDIGQHRISERRRKVSGLPQVYGDDALGLDPVDALAFRLRRRLREPKTPPMNTKKKQPEAKKQVAARKITYPCLDVAGP